MFCKLTKELNPVLFQIFGLNKENLAYYHFDNEEITMFPNEQEFLINEDLNFEIIDII